MRIISVADLPGRTVTDFDSVGFEIHQVGRVETGHIVCATLEPGGVIGRHPAVGAQMLVVIDGEAEVSGDGSATQAISAGQAVIWEAGEEHETRTATGLTGLIIEGVFADGAWER